MENLRNRINVKLLNNEKCYLKCTSKPSYMSHKVFDNNLVAIRKSKLPQKLNKPAHNGMCLLELSKELVYGFHYDYIKNEYGYNAKLTFKDTDSLMHEIKTEDFSSDKEMFNFSNYSKSKHYDDSNKLVTGKKKDTTGGVTIEEFVRLKSKMYSFLLDNNSEYKKGKGVNKYVVIPISRNEYKDALLSKKCIIHTMNKI